MHKDKEAGNMIQIKHRSTGKVIEEVDATSLVNADLRGANLRAADLRDADLRYANLWGADLRAADLRGTNLNFAKLQDANLLGGALRGANLSFAKLQGTNLQYANLQDANLQHAKLQRAKLQRAHLRSADLYSVNIRWVLGDGKRIKTMDDHYRIVIMLEYGIMAIECEQHSIDEWMNFSDEEIDKMDTYALRWWKIWKPRIQQLIAG
jgi:hypothetical protein